MCPLLTRRFILPGIAVSAAVWPLWPMPPRGCLPRCPRVRDVDGGCRETTGRGVVMCPLQGEGVGGGGVAVGG